MEIRSFTPQTSFDTSSVGTATTGTKDDLFSQLLDQAATRTVERRPDDRATELRKQAPKRAEPYKPERDRPERDAPAAERPVAQPVRWQDTQPAPKPMAERTPPRSPRADEAHAANDARKAARAEDTAAKPAAKDDPPPARSAEHAAAKPARAERGDATRKGDKAEKASKADDAAKTDEAAPAETEAGTTADQTDTADTATDGQPKTPEQTPQERAAPETGIHPDDVVVDAQVTVVETVVQLVAANGPVTTTTSIEASAEVSVDGPTAAGAAAPSTGRAGADLTPASVPSGDATAGRAAAAPIDPTAAAAAQTAVDAAQAATATALPTGTPAPAQAPQDAAKDRTPVATDATAKATAAATAADATATTVATATATAATIGGPTSRAAPNTDPAAVMANAVSAAAPPTATTANTTTAAPSDARATAIDPTEVTNKDDAAPAGKEEAKAAATPVDPSVVPVQATPTEATAAEIAGATATATPTKPVKETTAKPSTPEVPKVATAVSADMAAKIDAAAAATASAKADKSGRSERADKADKADAADKDQAKLPDSLSDLFGAKPAEKIVEKHAAKGHGETGRDGAAPQPQAVAAEPVAPPRTMGTPSPTTADLAVREITGASAAPAEAPGNKDHAAGHILPVDAAKPAAPTEAPAPVALRPMRSPNMPMGVTDQVAVNIHRHVADGNERFTIMLKPEELGRIDIRLEIAQDGRVSAIVAVDRPQTLELLQRDSRGLERALQEAGLKADSDSLSFSLRDDGAPSFADQQEGARQNAGRRGRGFGGGDDDAADAAILQTLTLGPGRVDVRV